jgi:DegV family protein with EDD domain
MSYKIVVDSCGELTERMKQDSHFEAAPLSLQVDERNIVDDETFNQAEFLKLVAASPNCPKSSCPSPERYMEAYKRGDADHVYAVTLSSELSGSYNSAQLGRNLLLEEEPDKKIHVFNSRSASVGETLIALKIEECEKAEMKFEEVVKAVEAYIASQHTFFVLETLETLRKNGRLSNLKAFVATALKIKPVMGATPEGTIYQLDQARGMNKALVKIVDHVVESTKNSAYKTLAIAHCNCPSRAEIVKEAILERMKLKDILVLDTAGISSMYASDGGIIIAV